MERSPAGHPFYSLPYKLTVSTVNSIYSKFDFEGLISGSKDILTCQKPEDYILVELEKTVMVHGLYLKGPFSCETNYERLNKSLLQVFDEEAKDWVTINEISVNDDNMFFLALNREMKTFRFI